MARGVNKVILIGNLGADPDMRAMPSGEQVVNISIATSESWSDKQTGEKRERTEWHRVVAFRKLAEIIGQYCRKGSKLYVEGRLQTRKWTDQNGVEKYTTEIIADNIEMLDSRSGGSESFNGPNQGQNYGGGQGSGRGQYGNQPAQPADNKKQSYGPEIDQQDFNDDDIPF